MNEKRELKTGKKEIIFGSLKEKKCCTWFENRMICIKHVVAVKEFQLKSIINIFLNSNRTAWYAKRKINSFLCSVFCNVFVCVYSCWLHKTKDCFFFVFGLQNENRMRWMPSVANQLRKIPIWNWHCIHSNFISHNDANFFGWAWQVDARRNTI